MTKKQKRMLLRILLAAVLFAALFTCEHLGVLAKLPHPAVALSLYLALYLLVGYDILLKAAKNIAHGQVFDENFLMAVASIAAFAIGEYEEAVAVMLFYQVGELFQSYAVGKSRRSIKELMDIAPEYANVETNGALEQVDPEEVAVGTVITVKPGERIPLDGVVLSGDSMVNTAALTGESVPRHVTEGSEVISGCINNSGTLRVETTKVYEDSTVARILELVENASSKKAQVENFITRFARWYTPVVTIAALLLAVIPPLFVGDWAGWIKRACTFLVISCPCALVISVPLGFFGGIGAASRAGILVKGSNYLEAASKLKTVVFDKTGTLTRGEFAVSEVLAVGCTEEALLALAAHAEGYSNHPIARSIREAYGEDPDLGRVEACEELAGRGLRARVDGCEVLLGNLRLLTEHGIVVPALDPNGTVVYVASDGTYIGAIVISDRIKDGAREALWELKQAGVRECVMLTGDHTQAAARVAESLGIDTVHAELLPGDKVEKLETLLSGMVDGATLAFVGDGVNDAPVLARADLGIAMGSLGSDAAIEAADVVIMDDRLSKLPLLVRLARKTMRIVRENIVFALGVKFAILILGALGVANLWLAVFADVGVAVLAILNSMRTLRYRP